MKKVIALVLCLLMVVSMAACGSQSTDTEKSSTPPEQNETVTPTTGGTEQPGKTSEPVETQPTTDSGESEASASTSPALEVSGVQVKNLDGFLSCIPAVPEQSQEPYQEQFIDFDRYTIDCGSVPKAFFTDYVEKVKSAGFTNEAYEGGTEYFEYAYTAQNADNSVKITVGCWDYSEETVNSMGIFVVVYGEEITGTWEDSHGNKYMPQLPELASADWRVNPFYYSYGYGHMAQSYGLSKEDVLNYVAELKDMGYRFSIEEQADGDGKDLLYSYRATSEDGKAIVEVTLKTLNDKLLTTIEGSFDKTFDFGE